MLQCLTFLCINYDNLKITSFFKLHFPSVFFFTIGMKKSVFLTLIFRKFLFIFCYFLVLLRTFMPSISCSLWYLAIIISASNWEICKCDHLEDLTMVISSNKSLTLINHCFKRSQCRLLLGHLFVWAIFFFFFFLHYIKKMSDTLIISPSLSIQFNVTLSSFIYHNLCL